MGGKRQITKKKQKAVEVNSGKKSNKNCVSSCSLRRLHFPNLRPCVWLAPPTEKAADHIAFIALVTW